MIPVQRLTPDLRERLVTRRSSIEGSATTTAESILKEFRGDPDGTLMMQGLIRSKTRVL